MVSILGEVRQSIIIFRKSIIYYIIKELISLLFRKFPSQTYVLIFNVGVFFKLVFIF